MALSSLVAAAAHAGPVEFSAHDIKTVFFFTTSDNKTHIDYGLRLKAGCVPDGDEPLFPYWRDYDSTPPGVNTNALKFFEYPAYGVREQKLERNGVGHELRVKLKALPRDIVISVKPGPGGTCTATPRTTVAKQAGVELLSAHIQVKSGWRVDYVEVKGRTGEGKAISERLEP